MTRVLPPNNLGSVQRFKLLISVVSGSLADLLGVFSALTETSSHRRHLCRQRPGDAGDDYDVVGMMSEVVQMMSKLWR
eukprot:387360-Rhodomonas_salina.1